jgi:hypothetical protein
LRRHNVQQQVGDCNTHRRIIRHSLNRIRLDSPSLRDRMDACRNNLWKSALSTTNRCASKTPSSLPLFQTRMAHPRNDF